MKQPTLEATISVALQSNVYSAWHIITLITLSCYYYSTTVHAHMKYIISTIFNVHTMRKQEK